MFPPDIDNSYGHVGRESAAEVVTALHQQDTLVTLAAVQSAATELGCALSTAAASKALLLAEKAGRLVAQDDGISWGPIEAMEQVRAAVFSKNSARGPGWSSCLTLVFFATRTWSSSCKQWLCL